MLDTLITYLELQGPMHQLIGLLLLSYILGSIPFGLIIGKLVGHGDIRAKGSGNIGATNMLRVGGRKLALITLILDGAKGAIAVLITKDFIPDIAPAAALFAVMGHMFPIWLKFKGGKGVATTLASLLALSLPHGLILCGVWLFTAFFFRYSSLAALAAMMAAPLVFHVALKGLPLSIVIIATLVYIRHIQNIQRLLMGEESKIGSKAK